MNTSGSSNFGKIMWTKWLRDHGFVEPFEIEEDGDRLFEQIAWSPGEPDRLAAWKLYTELRTRITTQPLAYRFGR